MRRGPVDEVEAWLREVEERVTPFMAWLGIVFALLVALEVAATDLSPGTRSVLTWAGWAIWALFVVEFGIRLWIAPRRRRFLRSNWISAVALTVPLLRVAALLRLLRLGRALPAARVLSTGYRARGTARRLLRSRLGYLAGVSSIVVLVLAELAFLLDRATFASFLDALLWATAVVLALQGDPVPADTVVHVAMLAGFAVGLVVIATLAGTLGAYLLEARDERVRQGEEVTAAAAAAAARPEAEGEVR
ncbi:MAG TPA: ion transporter [Miltoncostaeaceae bacterium]|nr:ion transporter [Miltoncostaeaceae bacterium]